MLTVDSTIMEAINAGEDVPETIADQATGEDAFTVGWHATDGWRGYYETTPLDPAAWERLDDGAVCGEWDDVPPGTRTSEVEARIERLSADGDCLLVILPTSNAFSTAYDLWKRVEA